MAGAEGAAGSWRLPTPPSTAELRARVPRIEPVPPGSSRPFWSVMIPAHNCAQYLRRTLASVLAQDPGRDLMHIEVIDDCSTRDDPAAVVQEIAPERVEFRRNPRNLGPTETFNECVRRSRGRWVHILHGDDLVLPGFYEECEGAIAARRDLHMVVGQVVMIDEEDRWRAVIGPPSDRAGGVFEDFLQAEAAEQLVQFAGVVVCRQAYEQVGGFCTLFGHVADLDMWFRVGQLGPVWCTRRPYGMFRVHAGSDTSQQLIRGTNTLEEYLAMRINLARLAGTPTGPDAAALQRQLARRAYRWARKLHRAGSTEGRLNQARWALRLHPTPKTAYYWLASWVLHARGVRPTPPG